MGRCYPVGENRRCKSSLANALPAGQKRTPRAHPARGVRSWRAREGIDTVLKQPGEPPVDTSRTLRTGGEGERPGGSMAMERTMTVTVDAIDKSKSSITFVSPNGWKYSRLVTDPNVLAMLKVGDKIDVLWNTDVTVAVE
jgi:hypothetical protein